MEHRELEADKNSGSPCTRISLVVLGQGPGLKAPVELRVPVLGPDSLEPGGGGPGHHGGQEGDLAGRESRVRP